MDEIKKEEVLKQDLSAEELGSVAGGGCWNSARFVAPDGHDVGCSFVTWYQDSVDDYKFMIHFPEICLVDGQHHDAEGRQYCGDGHYRVLCSKCGKYMDMNGNFSDRECACVDSAGNYLGMIR